MGKAGQQNLQRRPQGGGHEASGGGGGPSRFCCERCTMGLRRVAGELSLRCVVVLVLGVAVFLSGIFWVLPLRTARSGFDAKDAVKLSATVQVSFRLKKPVSEIVKCIGRLEYDIYSEIGVPDTKVAVLSAHQSSSTNYTDVVFGVLSDQMNVPINQVSLSVLRSYLIDLFLGQFNLTVTASLFGQPSELQILKFPGGITVNPMQSVSIWQTPQILFNFTLYQSIYDIQENFLEFKEQLKYGLHLRSYENVYVQVTNTDGSTVADFVTVEASVTSDFGSLLPQRLKQLAQIISGSPKNLGLDNSVFGNVKGVSLSSYLKDTLHSGPPTPSPAPSPSFVPSASPHSWPYSYSPSPSPNLHPAPPCPKCEISVYFGYLFISNPRKMGPMSGHTADCTCGGIAPAASPFHSSPAQTPTALPPAPAAHSPYISPTSQHSPSFSPSPVVSIASPPVEDKGLGEGPVSPSLAPLQSSFAVPLSHIDMRLLVLSTFLMNLLGWLSL